jgi:hypothetical protein
VEQINSQLQSCTRALDFYRERGSVVIETEHGWCNYYIMKEGVAYLENFHIYKEFRQSQKGTSLLMRLETQLQELEGMKSYFTTISTRWGDKDKTLQICLKRGLKFLSSDTETIFMQKEF